MMCGAGRGSLRRGVGSISGVTRGLAAPGARRLAKPLSSLQAEAEIEPFTLKHKLPRNLGELMLAAVGPLDSKLPGNGGLRLWHYPSKENFETEAHGLATGMAKKHDTYYTGFAGAKLVCHSETDPSTWEPKDKKALLDEAASMLNGLDGSMCKPPPDPRPLGVT